MRAISVVVAASATVSSTAVRVRPSGTCGTRPPPPGGAHAPGAWPFGEIDALVGSGP
ncbi:hypothetical protein [Nonomuraea sp. NPDC050691]|uniref:hypothetical protein n=1 Tax=Nonomuraea sp. NPDC050691 TaxID=3155661 RepID=UPI0033D49D2C